MAQNFKNRTLIVILLCAFCGKVQYLDEKTQNLPVIDDVYQDGKKTIGLFKNYLKQQRFSETKTTTG